MGISFKLTSPFKPTGDQPQAIEKLVTGLRGGKKHQVLLGVTGSGKTFTMANIIAALQKPTLVISHNKTLAAQLCQEFREFFPYSAVEYFVSYYDYYLPEAYIPQRDQYIAKEVEINEEIDKLRLSATTSLRTRRDVIVVASVSAIYNLGSPKEYDAAVLTLHLGKVAPSEGTTFKEEMERGNILKRLVELYYERADFDFKRSTFRVRGETVDLWPSYTDRALRLSFSAAGFLRELEKIDPVSGKILEKIPSFTIYPAKHYVSNRSTYQSAFAQIKEDLSLRKKELEKAGRLLEAHRLEQRTLYDLDLLAETGYCPGIENYSRYFDRRAPGEPPYTLLDYFPAEDFLLFVDESHMTIPQIRGMYEGDLSRKKILIDYGFRLPSALDNRPLKFAEFLQRITQAVYFSATPGEWEINQSNSGLVEQLIRPTGLLDPEIEIRPTQNQVDDLIKEIKLRTEKKERVLVTTLTKRMAEDLALFLKERGIKVAYLHADVKTLARTDILEDLRRGSCDVVVGINLLREGLDLPEVSLVAILDADKEGFLRSEVSLIQTMGRAARHISGKVIMYADNMTGSIRRAVGEVERRRRVQLTWNKAHKIVPVGIQKSLRPRLIEKKTEEVPLELKMTAEKFLGLNPAERKSFLELLEKSMNEAAAVLSYELAAKYRDRLRELKKEF